MQLIKRFVRCVRQHYTLNNLIPRGVVCVVTIMDRDIFNIRRRDWLIIGHMSYIIDLISQVFSSQESVSVSCNTSCRVVTTLGF